MILNKKTSYSKDMPNEIESETRFIAIRVTFFDFFLWGNKVGSVVEGRDIGPRHAISKGGRQAGFRSRAIYLRHHEHVMGA